MSAASYIELCESGEIDERIERLYEMLRHCELCPRECGVDRLSGETGFCRSTANVKVASAHPHFGEEDVLVGTHGSGTIFLTNCNLRCVFCQNYDISHLGIGYEVSEDELAEMMLKLQRLGCHNINFVTPTHFTPQIVAAIKTAAERGLRVPIVYNCGGYESVKTLRLLDGIIDIYMPDIKYSNSHSAEKYSNAPDYFDVCRQAVKEMHSQVGDLVVDERGIAVRGLIVRHLVMPDDVAGAEEIIKFIAELSKDTYVNIMFQYRPLFKAHEYREINRTVRMSEYRKVVETALKFGLHRGFSVF
ncbi:MAG: radical SAM protein [Canidatus Methanoxibalbensis ujae]|nr:radical SAM protein [Candidatus Methanoxibalbensis ujae]MCW7078769.1 radical SAM protein [Candidatus Methanoxibalbensis ujae]